MPVQQVHYTSCQHGTTGYAGFQVRAASPGIDPADLQAVVRRSGYRRPLNWPPDAELPLAYRFYLLPSGRLAVNATRYTGVDYSNREGNMFAHTLLLPADELSAYPTDYFTWDGWKKALLPEEDQAGPEPLPLLEAGQLSLRPTFAPQHLAEFLRQRDDRESRLCAMVQACFLSKRTGRSLVIRTATEDAVWWLATLHRCFPRGLASGLDVSSYEYARMGLPAVAATVAGTELDCDATQRQYQFYCFDEVNNCDSQLSEPDDADEQWLYRSSKRYAERAVAALRRGSGDLPALLTFLEGFDLQAIDADLARAADLYALLTDVGAAPDPTGAADLLQFALDTAPTRIWGDLFPRIAPLLQELRLSHPMLWFRLLAKHVTATAGADPAYERSLLDGWVELLKRDLRADDGRRVAEEAHSILRETLADADLKTARLVLGHAETLADVARQGDAAADRALTTLIHAADTLNIRPALEQPDIVGWIASVAEHSPSLIARLLPRLLSAADTADVFLSVCGIVGLTDSPVDPQLAAAAAGAFLEAEPGFPTGALSQARPKLALDVILREWSLRMDSATDPVQAFMDHHSQVIDRLPQADRARVMPWMREHLQPHVARGAAALRLGRHFFARRELAELAPELLKPCLAALSNTLPLDPTAPRDEELEAEVLRVAETSGLALDTGVLQLRELLARAANRNDPFPLDDLAKHRGLIGDLSNEDYALFIGRLLDTLSADRLEESRPHHRLLLALYRPQSKLLSKAYPAWMQRHLPEADPGDLGRYIADWLSLGDALAENPAYETVYRAIERNLIVVLKRYSDADYKLAYAKFKGTAASDRAMKSFSRLSASRDGMGSSLAREFRRLMQRKP
jgi:hypothetical protein